VVNIRHFYSGTFASAAVFAAVLFALVQAAFAIACTSASSPEISVAVCVQFLVSAS